MAMNNPTGVVSPQLDSNLHDTMPTDDLGLLRPGEKEYYSLEEFAQALFAEIEDRYAYSGSGH